MRPASLFAVLGALVCLPFPSSAQSAESISARQGNTPAVIAHRGGALLGTENSISCLANGIELGSDMVEIDVHLTADGELIVCHDPTIDRTTDGKGSIETKKKKKNNSSY